jgi:hypothetical protein
MMVDMMAAPMLMPGGGWVTLATFMAVLLAIEICLLTTALFRWCIFGGGWLTLCRVDFFNAAAVADTSAVTAPPWSGPFII